MHYKCTVLVAVVTIMGHPSESQDYVLLPGLNISGGGGWGWGKMCLSRPISNVKVKVTEL